MNLNQILGAHPDLGLSSSWLSVITLHHQYAEGYPDKNGSEDGAILVFVPGKP